MINDNPLKHSFRIPSDLLNLWIRNIEKVAIDKEWQYANKTAIKLMRADISTIGACLEFNEEELMRVRDFEQKDFLTLIGLLRRIEDNPNILRK